MTNTHQKVRRLIRGQLMEKKIRSLFHRITEENAEEFACYLPGLFRFLKKRKDRLSRENGCILLGLIFPRTTKEKHIVKLLHCIEVEKDDRLHKLLLKILYSRRLPEQLSLPVIKRMINTNDVYCRKHAIKAAGLAGRPGIDLLLQILGSTVSENEVRIICTILCEKGDFCSLAVLVARLNTINGKCDKNIHKAIRAIQEREGVSEKRRGLINDSETWKLKWNNPLEQLVGFVKLCAYFTKMDAITEEFVDLLAGIYIRELAVDISPYKDYKELRLAFNGKEWMEQLWMERSYADMDKASAFIDLFLQMRFEHTEAASTACLSEKLLIDCLLTKLKWHSRILYDGYRNGCLQ